MKTDLLEFQSALESFGLGGALRFLNARTPHRYTGIYRFDGDMLRNECLFDRYDPRVAHGDDVPMEAAYCALVGESEAPLEFVDARLDGRFSPREGSPVISYCGVVIKDSGGAPFGTLCHYDTHPCQKRISDIPLLEAVAPMLLHALGAVPGRGDVAN